ncbi:MAG TPA: hypothetical protein VE870_01780, partial [Bacteroidales bacterium]|nr:hypothetical protein [Bacteroidales bacterium]
MNCLIRRWFSVLFFVPGIFLPSHTLAQSSTGITSSTIGALRARHIGPATMSGRVSALDAVKTNPLVVYVGGADGGVWKSINGGIQFKPVFDDYVQSVGTITIDQSHPDTVWVGTGETWVRNSV